MMDISPVSEDFFYWDPEQLEDYQDTECSERSKLNLKSPLTNTGVDSNDFLSSITAIIKNKGEH